MSDLKITARGSNLYWNKSNKSWKSDLIGLYSLNTEYESSIQFVFETLTLEYEKSHSREPDYEVDTFDQYTDEWTGQEAVLGMCFPTTGDASHKKIALLDSQSASPYSDVYDPHENVPSFSLIIHASGDNRNEMRHLSIGSGGHIHLLLNDELFSEISTKVQARDADSLMFSIQLYDLAGLYRFEDKEGYFLLEEATAKHAKNLSEFDYRAGDFSPNYSSKEAKLTSIRITNKPIVRHTSLGINSPEEGRLQIALMPRSVQTLIDIYAKADEKWLKFFKRSRLIVILMLAYIALKVS